MPEITSSAPPGRRGQGWHHLRAVITALVLVLATVTAGVTAAAAPAQAICRPGIPGCPGGDKDPGPPPPPPPPPACDASHPRTLTDENPLVATSALVGGQLARATPHIRLCWDGAGKLTEVKRFAAVTVEFLDPLAYDYELVGGTQEPYIDGSSVGHYIQSIKLHTGASIEINGDKYGIGTTCTMTINREYHAGMIISHDDRGTCKAFWESDHGGIIGGGSNIPDETLVPLPYEPVDVVWITPDPPAPEGEDTGGELEIYAEDGTLIDSVPFGPVDVEPVEYDEFDPEWMDYFFEESDDYYETFSGGGGGGCWPDMSAQAGPRLAPTTTEPGGPSSNFLPLC